MNQLWNDGKKRDMRGQQGLDPNLSVYSTVLSTSSDLHIVRNLEDTEMSKTGCVPQRSSQPIEEGKQQADSLNLVWQQLRLRKVQSVMKMQWGSSSWFGPVTVQGK